MLLADTMGISVGTGVAGAIVAFAEATGRGLDGGLLGVVAVSAALALVGGWVAGRLPPSVLVAATSADRV
jgi:H+/Cl- antiporter ClcA